MKQEWLKSHFLTKKQRQKQTRYIIQCRNSSFIFYLRGKQAKKLNNYITTPKQGHKQERSQAHYTLPNKSRAFEENAPWQINVYIILNILEFTCCKFYSEATFVCFSTTRELFTNCKTFYNSIANSFPKGVKRSTYKVETYKWYFTPIFFYLAKKPPRKRLWCETQCS